MVGGGKKTPPIIPHVPSDHVQTGKVFTSRSTGSDSFLKEEKSQTKPSNAAAGQYTAVHGLIPR